MRDFQLPGRSPTYATRAMAATSHPLATEAAIATLRVGGTAADAAIAAVAVLCVVEPHQVSVAGDAFWIVGKPGQPLDAYNGSGRSAKAAELAWFKEQRLTEILPSNVHAATVPGAVDAWAALLERHGRFGLERALDRAIAIAEAGHPVAPRSAHDWALYAGHGAKNAGFQKHYLKDGRAPRVGEIHRHPALAATLRLIAAKGPRAVYDGEIAEDIVATLKAHGSLMTLDDFAAHRGELVTPITSTYRGKTVAEIPPNGQGLTALVILNILENFDLPSLAPLSPARFHLELEATRLGYAMRDAFIGEAAHMRTSVDGLKSKAYGKMLAGMISPNGRIDPARLPPPAPDTHTVYLSVVDENRMAVSFICSLFRQFGCGIVAEKSGLVLHNRGSSFRLIEGHPNVIGPAKRPMHTLIPGMMTDGGEVTASFGVMGGAYQACGHAHVLTNLIDYGMDAQAAIDCPRAFFDGPTTTVERTLPAATLEGLARLGHVVTVPYGAIGGGQIITIDPKTGVLCGGSDPRKDGCALGY